jgi:uncharacterized protein
MLEDVQGGLPEHLRVILGPAASSAPGLWNSQVCLPAADHIDYTRAIQQRFLDFVSDPARAVAECNPTPVAACSLCPWQAYCGSVWDERDDVSLVANIRSTQIAALRTQGVVTKAALATGSGNIAGIGVATLEKLRRQADLQTTPYGADGKLRIEYLPTIADKPMGFQLLPEPVVGDLYFDMEGFPHEPGGLEYLFGVGYLDPQKSTGFAGSLSHEDHQSFVFKAFWAHDRAQEKLAFEGFIDFVEEHLRAHPGAHIYHYAPYEKTAIRKLASIHDTRTAMRDRLLREHRLIDLYRVVASGMLLALPGYSIKKVEAYYRPGARETEVASGGDSIVAYEAFRVSDEPTEKAKILADLEEYNKDDVWSTLQLHDWLERLRATRVPVADRFTIPEEPGPSEAALRAEEAMATARHQLAAWVAATATTCPDVARVAALLEQLPDFYWRCELPKLWRQYARIEASDEDLLEDLDCLALLTRTGQPTQIKRSLRYTYQVPPQSTKLETDSKVMSLTEADVDGATINNLVYDETAGTVSFTRAINGPAPPALLTICASDSYNTAPKREAILRMIASLGEGADGALFDLLHRRLPRLRNRRQGEAIVADPDAASVARAVHDMNGTTLIIQGPPGTGKTTTAARVIASLLNDGKRVAITSNSHAVIANLFDKACLEARALGTHLHAARVRDGGTDADVISTRDADAGDHNLLGGTAWVFSREKHRGRWDYLFIDEASQVSLADVMAIGSCANNIVLLGDQMQLQQPTQGIHPGESGLSVLDYMMRGRATIPSEEGIFLAQTYRMHPDLCRPISALIYEGRLVSSPGLASQTLILTNADPGLRNNGISYVPVPHAGCSQVSQAECARISTLYQNLLGQRWRNHRGVEASITERDILILAPYNAQVRRLQTALGAAARVGTVDKFQGQEAAVCILSMTSSDPETMPRGVDFLFSRQRMNVAVSRARCLTVIVASPGLEAVLCSQPEDIPLVNFYARLVREGRPKP